MDKANKKNADPKSAASGAKQGIEGEGSYSATRKYNAGVAETVKSGRTEELGEKASEALDGAEGESLRKAEKAGKAGPSKQH